MLTTHVPQPNPSPLLPLPFSSSILDSPSTNSNRVRYFEGRVSYFNLSEVRKQCFLASDWLKYETLPRNYRTLSYSMLYSGYHGNVAAHALRLPWLRGCCCTQVTMVTRLLLYSGYHGYVAAHALRLPW